MQMKATVLFALFAAATAALQFRAADRTAPDAAAEVAIERQLNFQIHDDFAKQAEESTEVQQQVEHNKELAAIQIPHSFLQEEDEDREEDEEEEEEVSEDEEDEMGDAPAQEDDSWATFVKKGSGSCKDSSGNMYDGWGKMGMSKSLCEKACEIRPSCKAYEYQSSPNSQESSKVCVLRYYEGKALENVPSGWNQWTAGTGTGAVASTAGAGGVGGDCYEKQAVLLQAAATQSEEVADKIALGEEDEDEEDEADHEDEEDDEGEGEDEDEDEEDLEASVVMAAANPKKKKAETKTVPKYDKKAFKKDWHTEWRNGDFPGWKETYPKAALPYEDRQSDGKIGNFLQAKPEAKKQEKKDAAPTYDKDAFKKDWHTEWKNGDVPSWKETYPKAALPYEDRQSDGKIGN